MSDIQTTHKALLAPMRASMADFEESTVRKDLSALIHPEAVIHMPHPFGDLTGPDALYEGCYRPLLNAMPDLERRDWIVMGGPDDQSGDWVGCGGHYFGTFVGPWLDIPPTGHLTHMRFHEFYRFENGKVVEIQSLWDIP
ncbi:MAG: ester cyclase, partial [Pseudomonadota bacterium]